MIARRSRSLLALVAALACGCTVGKGEGEVKSDKLVAPDCWDDAYNMQPNFFGAVPYRSTLQIRIQRGSDLQEVSDGLAVLVDDIDKVRGSLGSELRVSLPAGVQPPGSPVGSVNDADAGTGTSDAGTSDAGSTGSDAGTTDGGTSTTTSGSSPSLIHMALYLEQSCHNQNTTLYSVGGTITFSALFDGDPNEKTAAEKYTDAQFDVMVGDPRDVPLGAPADAIPAAKQTHLTGYFKFYFQRGQPAQPFP